MRLWYVDPVLGSRLLGVRGEGGEVTYRSVVADPPWPYDTGFAQRSGNPHKQDRAADPTAGSIVRKVLPYPSMSVDEIKALPVGALVGKDARLFLWATNRYLPAAFGVVAAWGFSYRQLIVWDKRPNVNPLGGSMAPNSAEYLLVAQRGTPGRLGRWESSIIQARKARTNHSAKPDVFLDFVEAVSPGPYLELFARRNRLGWDTWGNEALNHIEVQQVCPRCDKPMEWRDYPDGHDPSPECPVPSREAGYISPDVVVAVCFAIATFCFLLLLLGGPNGAWR